MLPGLSVRVQGVSDSLTLKLNAQVQELQKQGVDVANLSTGEPDFAVPEASKEAVRSALKLNRSKYGPVAGVPELRERVARRTNLHQPRLLALSGAWKSSDVIITNGGKQALFNAMMAVLEAGDEALIPAPYWISYPDMAALAGATSKIIPTQFSNSFKLTPEELKASLDECASPKLLILNSPSNPTGAVYSREEFMALGEVIRSHPRGKGIWIISDEIYDRVILSDVPFCSFLDACPELRDQVITVNGMSKSAAMTGWRVGWSVASPRVTSAMSLVQAQSTSGINALAQWASIAALDLPETEFTSQIERYRARLALALEILKKAAKLEIAVPKGAFYIFFGVRGYLRPDEGTPRFCERLLREAKVAVVPGDPFGMPGTVRLSFATDETSLASGCRRFVDYLNR
jgi:aspartate aminotransferase